LQFGKEQLDGAAVRHDMVEREKKYPIVLCQLHHGDAQQWTSLQIEWGPALDECESLCLHQALALWQLAEVDDRHLLLAGNCDHLTRLGFVESKCRPQRLVSTYDLIKGPLKDGQLEGRLARDRTGNVIERAGRIEGMQEPHPPLRKRGGVAHGSDGVHCC